MSQPLWQKPGVRIDARIMRFLAGDDVVLDRELLPHDIRATRVHVEGLARIGVVTPDESDAVGAVLETLAADVATGAFVLDDRFEDGHSAIEHVVTEKLGDVGRKIHTGRSRNDQVLVATRLWLLERLDELARVVAHVAGTLLDRAEREAAVPMPGYTHLQRAVVSSVGMWCAGYAECFLDDLVLVRAARELVDANPLGTAAGYGVNLPLDRAYTTEALGFGRMQTSPIAAQLSRGKYELAVLGALGAALGDVRRLAWDLSLFTTAEYGFVVLPPEYTTGSSLMPNKKNPDVVELLRASASVVIGAQAELAAILSLPSGYQRDVQYTKGPIVRALRHGIDALALVPDLVARMTFDTARMRAAIDAGMYATDVAIEAALAGVPFREAYVAAAAAPPDAQRTPEGSLAARVSPGGAADPGIDRLRARLETLAPG